MKPQRLIVLALILAIATPTFGQVGEKITVNAVEVPVTVVDRDGNPVRGLTAANFELLDEGKLQKLTAFDAVDFASQQSVSAISPLNPVARRTFMLLFDLGFSSPRSLARAQEAARKFVKESVRPRDLIALGTIDVDRGFRLLASFTSDRELIAAAIDDPLHFQSDDPLQLANSTRTFEPGAESSRRMGANSGLAEDAIMEIAGNTAKQNEQFVRGRIEKQIGSLGALASTLRGIPGRKQIVFLSEGFDPKYVRGRDVRDNGGLQNDIVFSDAGQYWHIDNDERFGNSASLKLLDEMGKLFRNSDVVLHAIDIQGVRVLNDVGGTRFNSNDGLYLLARPTGGEVFANANSLSSEFAKMLHQQEVVYVLTFQASTAKPRKFHALNVKLVNVPGGRASFRPGYYEAGGDSAIQRTLTNAEIIINDIPQDDIHIAAMSGAFPAGAANAQVPVIVEMNGADLLKEAKGERVAAEVYLYAFDEHGVARDRAYQKVTLDLKKVGLRMRSGGVKYYATLLLPPGRYAIKTLVKLADIDRRGFARTDVVVPEASEVAMMPFFIDETPGDWLLVKGTVHASGAYPFAINDETLIPAAAAHDRAGRRRKLAVVVLNAKPDEITLQTNAKVLERVGAGDTTQLVLQPEAAVTTVAVKKGNVVATTKVQ